MAEIVIQDIRWHRAVLELRYAADHNAGLCLKTADNSNCIKFTEQSDENGRTARLDLMTAMGRSPLPGGTWSISGAENEKIRFVNHILADPDRYSRFFPYGKRKYAYAVGFSVSQTESDLPVVYLITEFYIRNTDPKVRKHSVRFTEKRIFRMVYKVLSAAARRNGKRILFFKQNGDRPTENMEALQVRMHERNVDENFKIEYRYRNIYSGRQRVMDWLRDMTAIARSDYIFIDDYTPIFDFIPLADDVVLTQLWHAGVGFKAVGYARFGLDGSPDPFSSAHRHYTYALIGNEHLRDIYAEVFGIEPEALLATGMPRLDHFLDESTAQSAADDLYGRFPGLKGKRVILFAPTFRGSGQKTAHYPYNFLNIAEIYRLCEETNSFFIFKMHHFIKEMPEIAPEFADRILDLSDENINEMFHIADVLITDFSSCFYDYLLLKKPVILYVPDKFEYIATRGLQRSIDEMAPGEICESFEALIDTLRTGHYETVQPKAIVIDRAAERSGLASDRVIDTVLFDQDPPGVRLDQAVG